MILITILSISRFHSGFFIIHTYCERKYLVDENEPCTFALNLVPPPQAKD